jgi:flagellar basal-body rod modification protein FlgD
MVDISAITTGVSASTREAASGLADNFEMFLTLLTEQMKNQDPLNPLESNEFVNQLVQFSSVEQQINQNANLESLIVLQGASLQGAAVSYIGREAQALTNETTLADGEASWSYTLPRDAAAVGLTIRDSVGRVVAREIGQNEPGQHTFTWDGVSAGGGLEPDGVYSLEISAVDAQGVQIIPSIETVGRVTGVDLSRDDVVIEIGGVRVPISQVRSLRAADPATT